MPIIRNLVLISSVSAVFGLTDCVEEIDAQRVLGYALFKDGKSTKLSYPLEKFHSDIAGRSFHNGRFIQRMRKKAANLSKYCHLPILHVHSSSFRLIHCFWFTDVTIKLDMHFGNMNPASECLLGKENPKES